MLLSICIPTFNRKKHLINCLNSIYVAKKNTSIEFEVCISDNCSDENLNDLIDSYKNKINITFNKNKKNIGFVKNYLKVCSIAKGKYIWLLGDDDMILPSSLVEIEKYLTKFSLIDFFFINSYFLDTKYVFKFNQPFDTKNIPQGCRTFSRDKNSRILNFFELIDPKISFDFLGGMYLAIFNREKWLLNVKHLNQDIINDDQSQYPEKKLRFTHFENTFPHIKIFSKAFSRSKACYISKPLSINLIGVREWGNLYPLVEIVRITESLNQYREDGLGLIQYLRCRNSILKNFIPYFVKILLKKRERGFYYIDLKEHLLKNIFFPNFYLSPIIYLLRKVKNYIFR